MLFPPFEPDRDEPRRRRFRPIPMRTLVPNVITLLALCAGLTSVRLAIEDHLDLALAAIVFAAVLDGVDGRVARLIKGTSRFGAELDSLADFVNFGVAPALILYFWGLRDLKSAGWIAAMVLAICAGLRLARFNVSIDDPTRPTGATNFFVGVPAPAGAITALLPIYLHFLGVPNFPPLTLIYTLLIALLMVAGVLGQEARHSRASGNGASRLRRGGAVRGAAHQLPLDRVDPRHAALSGVSAFELALVSPPPAANYCRARPHA
jgi:CDP-diacylglycerol---serine O-phosphatidyltransferase